MEFINNLSAYLSKNWQEWIGFAAGVTGVWLNMKQRHWAWLVGNISVVMYIVVFYQNKLYADMGLNIFYLISGFYGWYEWLFGKRNQEKLKVIQLSIKQMTLWLVGGVPVAILLYWFLRNFTDASVPEMDAPLTAFSFVGQFMLARKILQNWLVWVVVDFLSVGMYLYKGLYPTAVFFLIITAMAYRGYLEWKKELEPNLKGSTFVKNQEIL